MLRVIELATYAETIEDLDHILDGPLKELLGYEIMLCGTGFYTERGGYGYQFHYRYFPLEYFVELVNTSDGSVDTPLMERWRQTQKPVYFQSGRDDHEYPERWVASFNKFGLRNILGHAVNDRHGILGDYFIFGRLADPVGPKHAEILEIVTPSLCLALNRAMLNKESQGKFVGPMHALISKKQREILQWIYQGKTNWEISKILGMNEETVKYHVDQAMAKLNAKTRAQAVGRALEIGAISVLRPPSRESVIGTGKEKPE